MASISKVAASAIPGGALAHELLSKNSNQSQERAPRKGMPFKKTAAVAMGGLAIVGGVLRGCDKPGETTASAGYAALKSVSITAKNHKFCDASYIATVENAKAAYKKDIPGPFNLGITEKLKKTEFTAEVCVRTESIVGTYDAKKKKFIAHLTASADPKKSDFSVRVFPTSNVKVGYDEDKSIASGLAAAVSADVDAIPGVHYSPDQSVEDNLRGIALTVAEQQVAGPCGAVALKKLTDPNASKQSEAGADTTINQDIIDNFITKSVSGKSDNGQQLANYHIPATAWEVDIDGTKGMPNQYAAEYESLVKDGPKHHMSVPSNDHLPVCHTTPGSH